MARAQWVSLERLDALPDDELRDLITGSYRLVFERLPKKRQADLAGSTAQSEKGPNKVVSRKTVAGIGKVGIKSKG